MSQQAHESAAAQHEQEAADHAGKYKPEAKTAVVDCSQYLGSCWLSNPTEEHKKQADEHRQLAQAHRTASRALADAEAKACQGVPENDRDISPFFHREAISDVQPLTTHHGGGAYQPHEEEQTGATIVLLPAPGVTAERLQRVLQCHIARNAALGDEQREMPDCPLMIKAVSANVTSTGNGFAVNITATDRGAQAEIMRRAQALATSVRP